jgi:hypothetical protein
MASLCEQVVDKEINLLCGNVATDQILVRNRSAEFKVWVCEEHKAAHNRSHAAKRAESKR